jgi:hypothetical protein
MQPGTPTIAVHLVDGTLARFSFEDEHTKLSGNVSIGLPRGVPDIRTKDERIQLARERIITVVAALHRACARGAW